MSFIDLMGDVVWTPAQIKRRVTDLIRQKCGVEEELQLVRIMVEEQRGYTPTAEESAAITAFAAHVQTCQAAGDQADADNILLASAIEHEKAVRRLARYRLADGRHEQLAQDAVIDPETGEEISPAVPYLPAIEPLPALVDSVDEDGKMIQIPNPAIVKDDAERAAAQAVIDATGAGALDLVAQRKL